MDDPEFDDILCLDFICSDVKCPDYPCFDIFNLKGCFSLCSNCYYRDLKPAQACPFYLHED